VNDRIKELEEAAKPLVEFLRANYNPHVSVIVDHSGVDLCVSQIFVPSSQFEQKFNIGDEVEILVGPHKGRLASVIKVRTNDVTVKVIPEIDSLYVSEELRLRK
jgi:transcription antitermination factor NusG